MRDIGTLRGLIDKIDGQLVGLFEARLALVKEISIYKKHMGLALKDPKREAGLLKKNLSLLEDPAYGPYIGALLKDIMGQSKALQKDLLEVNKASVRPSDTASRLACVDGLEERLLHVLSEDLGPIEVISMADNEAVMTDLQGPGPSYALLAYDQTHLATKGRIFDKLRYHKAWVDGIYSFRGDPRIWILMTKDTQARPSADILTLYVDLLPTPGAIGDLLMHIGSGGFRLLNLESLPGQDTGLGGRYYLDIEGHIDAPGMRSVLKAIEAASEKYIYLGNYNKRRDER